MRTCKRLIFGGSVMLLAAFLTFIVSPNGIFADTVCDSSNCYVTDTTINDLSQGKFYLTGLSNNGDGAVQLVPLGLTAEWVGDQYTLPVSRTELAAVIYKDIIYVVGGKNPGGVRIPQVITASTYVTGPLKGAWQTATTLNPGRSGMAAVISTTATGGYLYVLGGSHGPPTVITNAVSYIHFNTNGQFDTGWQTGSSMATELVYHQAVVHNGYLYVLGGCNGISACNTVLSEIYRAQISPSTGELTWDASFQASLPSFSLDLFGAVIWQSGSGTDYLYIVGGVTDELFTLTTAEVWYIPFDGSGGLDSPTPVWTPTGSLNESYGAHSTVQGNGQIFSTGGLQGSSPGVVVSNVNSALIDVTSGGLLPLVGSSSWMPSKVLPEPRWRHASVINSGGVVYVIGGTSETAGASNTVYRGETKGFGSLYAGRGTYISHILDLTTPRDITEITVNSTITSPVTMTMQYRFGNTPAELNAAPFTTTFPGLNTGLNVSTTTSVNFTASLIQYQVLFTGTHAYTSTMSPVFNAFQVKYPLPPILPDFEITGLSAPPESASPVTQTITYWVSDKMSAAAPVRLAPNAATSPQSSPTGKFKVPPPPPRSSSGRVAAPNQTPPEYLFYVSFYAFETSVITPTSPISLTGAMNCIDYNNPLHPPGTWLPFIWWNPAIATELSKTPKAFYAQCLVPANSKKFWAQIDSCALLDPRWGGSDPYCKSYGYVLEQDETGGSPSFADNIYGPVDAGQGPTCYTLTTVATPSGKGSISVNTPPNCGPQYTSGTVASLTAIPAGGSTFSGWTGCDLPLGANCSMTMNATKSVTATFASPGGPGSMFLPFIRRQ